MPIRTNAALVGAGTAAALLLAGCVNGPAGPAPDAARTPGLAARARQQAEAPPAPELRIPASSVAQGADVPVVPVPPIPLGQGQTLPRTTVPPAQPTITPASTLPPAAPRVAVAREPSPLPPAVSTDPPPAPDPDPLRTLIQKAGDTYGGCDSYIARLTRREQVGGKNKPEEILLFKFRKQPWSVYFKWLSDEGKGREVVYVKDRYENKIHTLLAAGDVPLTPAGKRVALAVDSLLVKSASRHPITEAGMGASIERLGKVKAALDRGEKRLGSLSDLGVQNRADYAAPLRLVEHSIPAGLEEDLPRGGKRLYGFDTTTSLPVLLVTRDDKVQEVEYYRYDRVQFPVHLDDNDFNPDKLWALPARSASAPR